MATNQTTKTRFHPLYFVKDDPNGGKGVWRQVGVAFEHKDGNGWNICFDVPLVIAEGTRLTHIQPKEKSDS